MAEQRETAQNPQIAEPETDAGSLDGMLHSGIARDAMRLIWTRWVAGSLVILATLVCVQVLHLPLPERLLYITGATVLAYNIPLTVLMRRTQAVAGAGQQKQVYRLVILQVLLDWLSMSAVVHLTGGITSPAIYVFLIHMLMVTILLPDQSPYGYVALGTGALIFIAIAERSGTLPHYVVIPGLPSGLYASPIYVVAQILLFAIVAFAAVYLTASMMRQLRQREHQVTTLLATAQTVSASLDPGQVMQHLVQSAANALSASAACIRLLDDSGERLEVAACVGLSSAYLGKGMVELSRSPLDQEALFGASVIIKDASADSRLQYQKEVLAEGIRSLMVVPIIGRGRSLGVLRVYSRRAGAFDEDDLAFVRAIAQQGAAGLQNALAHDLLQKTEVERAEFVRSITHELRAPVSSSQSLLRTLARGMAGELSAKQREILERMERRFNTLLDLINDLLALAASKTTLRDEALEPLGLGPIINQIIEQWASAAAEKQVVLCCNTHEATAVVSATQEGLERIFDNLVGNAVKYTPRGGRVTLGMAVSPGVVTVTVADTGIGIPQADLAQLWHEFFRARNARTSDITGTGLGLSIVKRLVERYHGVISVQSVEGEGTTFSVRFPLASEGTAPDCP